MVDKIEVEYVDAVNMRIIASDRGLLNDLSNHFKFHAPNYRFHPKFKSKIWDGYIRLFQSHKPYMLVGLLDHLKLYCQNYDIELTIPKNFISGDDISDNYGYELAKQTKSSMVPYDYQNKYIVDAIRDGRSLSISPTSSGKSFIIYLLLHHYMKEYNSKIILIVPRIQLVEQMANDFISYGCDESIIAKLGDGRKDDFDRQIVISTYQTLAKMKDDYFSKFDVVIGDEAHTFESKTLQEIMSKLTNAHFRHGFTGTISSESKVHKLQLEALFGRYRKHVSTVDLIENKVTADFKIKMLMLNHTEEDKSKYRKTLKEDKELAKEKKIKSMPFSVETSFLNGNEKRNNFIRNLVKSLPNQNNIIFFDRVEEHGKILKELLQFEDRILFFIYGNTPIEEREKIRHIIENDPLKRYNIVASSGTTSTGVSIKRIDNAIFTSGSKSEIKTLQSIGRLLRRGNGSDNTTLYDIGDKLFTKGHENYSYKHFIKRMEMYSTENFDYKSYTINL